MAPQYKLTYFDLTGLGEPIRLLFHYGGISFVDNRISKEQWPALKSQTPLGQLPLLEVDGKVLFQSVAIARYVASQVGLGGKTDLENWEIDAVVDTVNDLRTKIAAWYFEPNAAAKQALKESLDNETLPFLLSKLDAWASKSGGYLANGKFDYSIMAPKYKLTYFDFTGLGEPIRFLLSYGSLDFEDHRVTKDDWPSFKHTTPLGQMPLLEFDGNLLYQNTSIARYLGHIVGLAGNDPLENWAIDSVVDALTDLRIKIFQYNFEPDEQRKEALKATFEKETLPSYLTKFEEWATKNNGHLAAGKLTWADLYFIAVQEFFGIFVGHELITDEYPNLQTVRNNVLSLPQIRAWLNRRPELKL